MKANGLCPVRDLVDVILWMFWVKHPDVVRNVILRDVKLPNFTAYWDYVNSIDGSNRPMYVYCFPDMVDCLGTSSCARPESS